MGLADNNLGYVVALTTDEETVGRIANALALEVVIFNGSSIVKEAVSSDSVDS
jgi:hypothetical protein